jgi:AcrR family transcriptional regulator
MSDGKGTAGDPRAVATSFAAVDPQLRYPGTVLGPRASRTITTILDATRQIFLTKGYAGTTIDEIARVAGVSRGSFYTYFPSKRDALLALGANSLSAGTTMVTALEALPRDWTVDDLGTWVGQYLELLDDQGSFAFAWTQAAHDDDEILRAGMKGHLQLCRKLGIALAKLGGKEIDDPTELGLLTVSVMERGWAYCQLYEGTIDKAVMQRRMARMVAAMVESA